MLGHYALQLPVFILPVLQLFRITGFHAAKLRLPAIVRREGDGVANTGNDWTRNEHRPKGAACKSMKTGAPGEIRTPDLLLRRLSELSRRLCFHRFAVAKNRI